MKKLIDNNDPLWEQHSGGEGHDGIEWAEGDEQLAHHLYDSVGPNGRLILDLLIDNPGERLSADHIAVQLTGGVAPSSAASGRHRVAASLITVGEQLGAQRRLPFYWWRGSDGDASLYAMKPSVAELFRDARSRLPTDTRLVKEPSHRALAWTREEDILALDLFVNGGALSGGPFLSENDPRVVALSDLLRALPTHPEVQRDDRFRNPSSVALKLMNFRAVEKVVKTELGVPGAEALPTGMPSFGALDRAIFVEYFSKAFEGLAEDAEAIRSAASYEPTSLLSSTQVEDRPVEEAGTATYETVGIEGATHSRAEHDLVQRYVDWLSARSIKSVSRLYRVPGLARPFFCDVFLPEKNALIEAKSSDRRETIRMAVGQLLDYQYLEGSERTLAVLLPYAPAPEIRNMLDGLGIGVIWPHGDGFRDSRAGAFTKS